MPDIPPKHEVFSKTFLNPVQMNFFWGLSYQLTKYTQVCLSPSKGLKVWTQAKIPIMHMYVLEQMIELHFYEG